MVNNNHIIVETCLVGLGKVFKPETSNKVCRQELLSLTMLSTLYHGQNLNYSENFNTSLF